MSRPRQILLAQYYLITRRCTQRLFLLRPDEATNNAFLYCLIVAAIRYRIDIMISMAESNHHHTVIFDRHGNMPAFVEHFHKLVARSQNALRGRSENMWASVEPSIMRLLDPATVIDKMIYSAANPVKDRLVERVHHWPGVNTYRNLLSGEPVEARRPSHFFRESGSMPETVSLEMTIPPELGNAADIIAAVREGVERIEREQYELRKATGARVIGRKRILAQSWSDSPESVASRRELRPRFAGTRAERIAALTGYRMFLDCYRSARERWLQRMSVVFPVGTYWLARFAAVPVG